MTEEQPTEEQPKDVAKAHVIGKALFWLAAWGAVFSLITIYDVASYGREALSVREVFVDSVFLTPVLSWFLGVSVEIKGIQKGLAIIGVHVIWNRSALKYLVPTIPKKPPVSKLN
jgi:hypothetical protein